MPSPPPAPRRTWSFRRKLALQFLLLPVLLVSIELFYRGWQGANGETYRSDEALASMQRIAASLDGSLDSATAEKPREGEVSLAEVFLHPFLGFAPENFRVQLASDAAYFRRPVAEKNYDLMIVGGSVAARMCQTATMTLVESLHADPRIGDRRVQPIFYPTGGYKQPQQLNLVAYALNLGFEPDAVINIDGFNELALSNYNARHASHPMHPSLGHWGHLIQGGALDRESIDFLVGMRQAQRGARQLADLAQGWGLQRSAVLGRFALSRLERLQEQYASDYERYVVHLSTTRENPTRRGPDYAADLKHVLAAAVRNWKESSRSLSALCAARGIHYVHALQPTLFDEGSKPLTEAEIATGKAQDGWVEAVREGYPRLRKTGERLRAKGVNFVDCSMLFADVKEDLYVDACHFNEAGSRLLASEISKAFLASMP